MEKLKTNLLPELPSPDDIGYIDVDPKELICKVLQENKDTLRELARLRREPIPDLPLAGGQLRKLQ